ncbi:zinc finger translocation-associated protein isoform X3 [Neoarius graeffei]|uniref:zinc finger translocation-associated protein isoform X3 n=1 Tax=Neoarius graeffei TaxID=443677 RepID=UPI00298C5F51|nr:zinc finger translocation-associated protein isoform X3 [Neoarius graeffei]
MAPRLHGLHYKQRRNPVPCRQRCAGAPQRKSAPLQVSPAEVISARSDRPQVPAALENPPLILQQGSPGSWSFWNIMEFYLFLGQVMESCEDDMTNGHVKDDHQTGLITHVDSSGTSYWSILESPESPFLLSPVPGPSRHKTSPVKSGRASRTGHSRIPGRDHRRYYHEHWRTEYLMDFDPKRNGMICMVCGSSLATLKLSTIKRHIRQKHPDSLLWSASDKEVIRSGWENHLNLETSQTSCPDSAIASEPEETLECTSPSTDSVKSEPDTKDLSVNSPAQQPDSLQHNTEPHGQSRRESAAPSHLTTRLKNSCPWHLRLDYLVAIGPPGMPGCYCMVCSEELPVVRVSSFRRHIQDCHPETSNLSQREREDIASAWTEDGAVEEPETHSEQAAPSDTLVENKTPSIKPSTKQSGIKKEDGEKSKIMSAPIIGRHSHYPGKDQRRNYQVRWRMEYLMDYDCRRHGLICMVCGATLATLKVSTIKRHIQQVHPHSLNYSPEEKQQAVQSYSQATQHFVHSDYCFSGSDHSHVAQTNTNAQIDQV